MMSSAQRRLALWGLWAPSRGRDVALHRYLNNVGDGGGVSTSTNIQSEIKTALSHRFIADAPSYSRRVCACKKKNSQKKSSNKCIFGSLWYDWLSSRWRWLLQMIQHGLPVWGQFTVFTGFSLWWSKLKGNTSWGQFVLLSSIQFGEDEKPMLNWISPLLPMEYNDEMRPSRQFTVNGWP